MNSARDFGASVTQNEGYAIGNYKRLVVFSIRIGNGVGKENLPRMQEVRESAQRVAEQSIFVRIDSQAVARFAEHMGSEGVRVPSWDAFHHFRGSDEETVTYCLLLDTLNFFFWPPMGKDKWEVEYEGRWFSGYYALALSLKKAMERGLPLTNAQHLACLSMDELEEILSGRGTLQFMDLRLGNIRELGRVLLKTFHGKAHELVASAQESAVALVRILSDSISSFKDISAYGGKKVFFYKRAQLFAADLNGVFGGKGWGAFHDLGELTAFADYKLPQVLRHVGVLEYAEALAEKVDQMALLEPGSREEVEIRANTIRAVEMIREELRDRGRSLMAFEIDWLLWNHGQEDRFRKKPYHRCMTIFY
jgi:hypothetical protein